MPRRADSASTPIRSATTIASPALTAAAAAVAGSALAGRCEGGGSVSLGWVPSPTGAWQGGSVTVTIRCDVRNQSLTGLWSPGTRTITMADTQPVDRYQR